MKTRKILGLALLVFSFMVLMSSCIGTSTSKTSRTASFYPNVVRYELSSDKIQLLGEMEISISYKRYLGIFRIWDKINGEDVNRRVINTITLYGDKNISLSRDLQRALYGAHVQYPEADFLIPVFEIVELETMFLGRRVEKRAKIKAYKLLI